uniref:Uncharacterized protein n=1 Tax=Aegilops tauschii subsp. strangulata TaxID=200361 RepID=A0A453KDK5_AEGTS
MKRWRTKCLFSHFKSHTVDSGESAKPSRANGDHSARDRLSLSIPLSALQNPKPHLHLQALSCALPLPLPPHHPSAPPPPPQAGPAAA